MRMMEGRLVCCRELYYCRQVYMLSFCLLKAAVLRFSL